MKNIELLHFTVAIKMSVNFFCHFFGHLLKSGLARINWIRAVVKICVEQLICCQKCRANDCRAVAFWAVHPHSFNFFHLQLKYLGSSWISSIYYCLMWLEIKQISNTICYCIDLFNSRRKWLRIYLMPFYWIFSLCCRVLLAAAKIPKILISSMKIKTKQCVLLDLWWVTHFFNKCHT